MGDERVCASCGKGTVAPLAKAGRRMTFRNFPALPVPESMAIPTCGSCGEEWYDGAMTEALESALSERASELLSQIAVNAIGRLAAHCTQRELERLLDLSHGYLSKLKHGKEAPSALLTVVLALLANDPHRRLEEIRETWRTQLADSSRGGSTGAPAPIDGGPEAG